MKLSNDTGDKKNESGTLTSRIKAAENRIMDRRHCVQVHSDALVQDLRREITSPTALLLAAELGFMIGELTKSPPESERYAAAESKPESKPQVDDFDVTPLKKAMNFGSLMLTLYHALPLAWIMDTFHPEAATDTGSALRHGKAEKINVGVPPRQDRKIKG